MNEDASWSVCVDDNIAVLCKTEDGDHFFMLGRIKRIVRQYIKGRACYSRPVNIQSAKTDGHVLLFRCEWYQTVRRRNQRAYLYGVEDMHDPKEIELDQVIMPVTLMFEGRTGMYWLSTSEHDIINTCVEGGQSLR